MAAPKPHTRSELTEGLAARILEHIGQADLAAGTHLAAQDLADRFNVSRSPVNRALRLLHAKGVLAHEQQPWLLRCRRHGSASPHGVWGSAAEDRAERGPTSSIAGRPASWPPAGAGLGKPAARALRADASAQLVAMSDPYLAGGLGRSGVPAMAGNSPRCSSTPEALVQTYRVRMALEPAALLEPGYRLEPATDRAAARGRAAAVSTARSTLDPPDKLHERGCSLPRGDRRRLPQPVLPRLAAPDQSGPAPACPIAAWSSATDIASSAASTSTSSGLLEHGPHDRGGRGTCARTWSRTIRNLDRIRPADGALTEASDSLRQSDRMHF